MKLAKFERKQAKRLGVTVEWLREHFDIQPCDCGRDCKGWHIRYKLSAERRREAARA